MAQLKELTDDNLLDIVITMVKETPNDMELGAKIRMLFNAQ